MKCPICKKKVVKKYTFDHKMWHEKKGHIVWIKK